VKSVVRPNSVLHKICYPSQGHAFLSTQQFFNLFSRFQSTSRVCARWPAFYLYVLKPRRGRSPHGCSLHLLGWHRGGQSSLNLLSQLMIRRLRWITRGRTRFDHPLCQQWTCLAQGARKRRLPTSYIIPHHQAYNLSKSESQVETRHANIVLNISRHVLNCLVQNEPGVLSRVSGILAGRGFNIDSLVVCRTEIRDLSRMCIVLSGQDGVVEQARRQLEDLVRGTSFILHVC
jgi:hypothetical protein